MDEKQQNPMEQTKAAVAEWKRLADEQLKRFDEVCAEMGRYQKQSLEQLGTAIDEVSKLLKSSLEFAHQVSAKVSTEMRSAAQETVKRAGETLHAIASN
jgi:hypothetical protein